MRRAIRSAFLFVLGAGGAGVCALAQGAGQQNVTVVVLNAQNQPAQPVKAVRVSLSYLDSAVLVTDAQEVTNTQGQALLVVSRDASQRGDLRIGITGASDLVIFQPADGQLPALPATVKVSLLPKGSPALLGPAQIEAMLHRTLLQVTSLKKENSALKAEVAESRAASQAQSQQQDLTAALVAFAQANGFASAQVDQQVQIWAQNVQLQSDQSTAEQRALAEFALKHYSAAAQSFERAADTTSNEIDATEAEEAALEKALLDKVRGQVRQLINDREQAAGAYQLNLQYHKATQTLESAEARAEAEWKKHPDDKGFHELWLTALLSVANARGKEGEVSPASESLPLLAESVNDFENLGKEYAGLGDRPEGAAAEDGLGNALDDEGERASGDKAVVLLDRAAQAYQKALEVRTKGDAPLDWAATENDLGNVLRDEANRTGADKAVMLFGEAVEAYRNALEVRTRGDLPQEWATTQNNLGLTLRDEGLRASGDKAIALYEQSVEAYRSALEVRTQADLPQDWALTEMNLGVALDDEGARISEDKAAGLFEQSEQAFENALKVFTKAEVPQNWANAQVNLGNMLKDEAEHASGEKAVALLEQSVEAYQNALEVDTKAELPQDWALTQQNLGNALERAGEDSSGSKAVAFYDQAVQAFEKALEVDTKADLPQYWAVDQTDLGDALVSEALLLPRDAAAPLFDRAIAAWRQALEVFSKSDLPNDWVITEMNIMEASFVATHFTACARQADVLTADTLSSSQVVVRDTMALACQWGSGDKRAALATETTLAAKAALLQASVWDFSGSLLFLGNAPEFETGRPAWIALFTAVQNGNRAGMTAALRQLEPILRQ